MDQVCALGVWKHRIGTRSRRDQVTATLQVALTSEVNAAREQSCRALHVQERGVTRAGWSGPWTRRRMKIMQCNLSQHTLMQSMHVKCVPVPATRASGTEVIGCRGAGTTGLDVWRWTARHGPTGSGGAVYRSVRGEVGHEC